MSAMKRRDNRAGTVYKNETTGQWVAEIRWVDKAGKSQRKTFSSKKSKTAVVNKLSEFKRFLMLSDGLTDDVTFEEVAEKWLEIEKKKMAATSYQRKRQVYEHQVLPRLGGYLMDEITTQDVQNMINDLEREGVLSYSTIKKAREIVSSCFKYYRTTTHKSNNPTEGVVLDQHRKRETSDIDFFQHDERLAIRDAALAKWSNGKSIYRFGHAFLILMYTGIRLGELLALTWKDVDYEEKKLKIIKHLVVIPEDDKRKDTHFKLVVVPGTKYSKKGRDVQLNDYAIESFKELEKITGKNKYIISSSTGHLYTPRNMERTFEQILKRAKIDHGTIHSLRHTFATMLFEQDIPVKTVSKMLGHKDTKVTENTYIHVIKEKEVEAVSKIEL